MTDLKIAVIGAGVIGRTHIETLGRTEGMRLSAIVDPMEAGARLAEELGVAAFREPGDLLKAGVADAVVVATPNESHVPISTRFLDANIPVLLEKPVANTIEEGRQLEEAVARTGVPLLVGHHRRHNPIIKTAKKAIDNGDIGDLVTAVVNSTLTKPSDYFVAWRIAQGTGGPLNSTTSVVLEVYKEGFSRSNMGYAAAMAWFLFLIILVITLVQWRVIGRHVEYG